MRKCAIDTMPKLSVQLTDMQHKQLKAKAAWLSLTQSEIVKRFLLAWFEKKIELPEDEENVLEK